MRKILVVIDMQNDFIDGSLGTPEARAIVDKVCDKIRGEEWDWIFFTKDCHQEDYLETPEGQKLQVEHCIIGTEGHKINADVGKAIFNHRHCSYHSPVYKDTFGSTDLPFILRSIVFSCLKTEFEDVELTLIGVCTDICVISNALLLKAHYPEMKIVVDASCCAGSSIEKHYMALEVMKSCQVDVVNDGDDMIVVGLTKEEISYIDTGIYVAQTECQLPETEDNETLKQLLDKLGIED